MFKHKNDGNKEDVSHIELNRIELGSLSLSPSVGAVDRTRPTINNEEEIDLCIGTMTIGIDFVVFE